MGSEMCIRDSKFPEKGFAGARHGSCRGQGMDSISKNLPEGLKKNRRFYVQVDLNFSSNSNSILRPIRPQFYVQFDLNFTSNSTSILRPIRSQFYIQFDLNFIRSNSTSISRPHVALAPRIFSEAPLPGAAMANSPQTAAADPGAAEFNPVMIRTLADCDST